MGNVHDIQNLIDEYKVKEIIIALEKENHDVLVELISKCELKM